MNETSATTGTLETALAHAMRLLDGNPQLAREQAQEILHVSPGHPLATLIVGAALRQLGEPQAALEILQPLAASQPNWARVHHELGMLLAEMSHAGASLAALRRAVSLKADLPDAWRAIGDHLTMNGDAEGADAAYAQHIKASTKDPRLLMAASALVDGRIAQAEALLRTHLRQIPTDVVALRMLAEVAARLGRNADAESLLERCLELAPSFTPARHQYAIVLQRQNKALAALHQIALLAKLDPRNPSYRNLQAVTLVKIGEYQQSIEIYGEVLAAFPNQAKIWLSYGHTLATAGREKESIAAYRRAIELAPQLGEAFWSLANLKTFRFAPAEVSAMHAQLERTDLSEEDRYHFDFALGKALEDTRDYQDSFRHYELANHLRKLRIRYDADETSSYVRRSKALLTADFFAARADHGIEAADPIFIVGMPRAGSTLIEQILASHSAVEGTMELPDIMQIAAALGGKDLSGTGARYPAILAELTADDSRRLGRRYLDDTRIQRKAQRTHFIDKMPNNFLHIGLILLTLPKARIIDARRHPMACCFSGFKQQFAQGHAYSYSLQDLGHYYRDYVDLMDHFDRVMPGRILRVRYESVVDDTEAEVRRLLGFCGLEYEAACLRFHENQRPVRTASSQQVRKPIYREGVEQWLNYAPWLGPLRDSLGDAIASYEAATPF